MRFTPWMAAALALVPLLQACGGGSSSGGDGAVRLINAAGKDVLVAAAAVDRAEAGVHPQPARIAHP